MKKLLAEPLDPYQIVRTGQAKKYFGFSHSQLAAKIKSGEIPPPLKLSETGRASGWLGRTIIDYQQQLLERAEREQARLAASAKARR